MSAHKSAVAQGADTGELRRENVALPRPRRSLAANAATRTGKNRGPSRRANRGALALFLLPFTTLFALFYVVPIGYAVYQSMFGLVRDTAYGAPRSVFVGLTNYTEVITDPSFQRSIVRVLEFGIGPSLVLIVVALVVALLIDGRGPGLLTALFRLATFAPYAVPAVIGAIMWGFLYAPSTSPVLQTLHRWGLNVNPLQGDSALWAVGNVAIWTYAGYNTLIFLTGLSSIDPDLFEAARLDGASPLRIAWSIKLPLLRPSIVLSAVFNLIGTLQLFTEPAVLRAVSSGITSNWTPNMLAYSQAAANQYSFAAAVAVVLAVATAVLSFGLLRVTMRGSTS